MLAHRLISIADIPISLHFCIFAFCFCIFVFFAILSCIWCVFCKQCLLISIADQPIFFAPLLISVDYPDWLLLSHFLTPKPFRDQRRDLFCFGISLRSLFCPSAKLSVHREIYLDMRCAANPAPAITPWEWSWLAAWQEGANPNC